MSVCSSRVSCFNLQDHRVVKDGESVGSVENKANGRMYGTVSKDSDRTLRLKFAFISAIQAPVMILGRIPYRIYSLFTGDFVESGVKAAKKEWQLKRQEWSLQPAETRPIAPPNSYNSIVAKHVIWHLAKNIFKIITMPLAILAQQFAALYGLINPQDGRILFASLNELWARDITHMHGNGGFKGHMLHISDYLGFCLQPKDIWDSKNLYRVWPDYNPLTIRALLKTLTVKLQEKQTFFDREGLNMENVLTQFRQYIRNVREVSQADINEILPNGNLDHTDKQKAVCEKLLEITTNLAKIEEMREKHIGDLAMDTLSYPEDLINPALALIQTKEQILLSMEELNALFQVN